MSPRIWLPLLGALLLLADVAWANNSSAPAVQVSEACMRSIIDYKNKTYQDYIMMVLYSGPQQLGNYDECQDLTLSKYCVFTYYLPGIDYYAVRTGVCVPVNCTDSDLAQVANVFLPNTTRPSAFCVPKELPSFPPQAIVMLCVLGTLVVICAIAAMVEWKMMRSKQDDEINQYAMESEAGSSLLSVQAVDGAYIEPSGAESTLIVVPGASNASSSSKVVRMPTSPSNYRRAVATVRMVPQPVHAERTSTFTKIILCFSPIRNLGRLFAPTSEPNLASLNGLRTFSMFWILLGHTTYYSSFMFDNPLHILNVISRQFEFQILANANFAVDAFFYMSGFLVGYLTLRELMKKGRIPLLLYYLHRIWRLTPPLLMMILVLWLLSPYLGNGPWWYEFRQTQVRHCSANWWAPLLYINNFYPTDFMQQCGEWTWFSAVDFQFYAITPIILYLYWRWRKLGLALIGALLAATLTACGIVAYQKEYTVNVLDLNGSDFSFMSEFYDKPWTRLPAYLIGLLASFYYIHVEDTADERTAAAAKWSEKHHEPVKRPMRWWLQFLVLGTGLAITSACAFGTYSSFQPGQSWTARDPRTIIWNTFSRVGFAFGLACIMHTLYMGHGFFINRILSWEAWSPLARLTYSAYLYHPMVMQVVFSNFKTLVHYDYWNVGCFFLAFTLGSYMVALGSYLLIERPIMNLEGVALPHHK